MKYTFLLFILINITFSYGQGYSSKKSDYFNLKSERGTEYMIKVTLPLNYDESKSYKSVYYLDGFGMSDIVLGANSILNIYDKKIEDLVFIGISYSGSRSDWIKFRTFDYTPIKFKSIGNESQIDTLSKIKIKKTYKTEGYEMNENNTGGGKEFLKFIEEKIIKLVNSKYKNLSSSRTIIGHSFGGLFTTYALQNRPNLFKNYIIISASLSMNSYELVKDKHFEILNNYQSKLRVFNCYGGLEPNITKESNDIFTKKISQEKFSNINYKFQIYNNEGHTSILKDAIYDGLKFIYQK
ncbi:alpha/beta hydrolase [Winogradskyella vidalii]|uniref:alpha/beta hydrolase n=1 Tax=Winogradskyella vidalii TaxID=2615024 RepID=UPI0015CC36B6|nr:alpha/beta hydrolase-fold protein [Winogradskyella vidalii]